MGEGVARTPPALGCCWGPEAPAQGPAHCLWSPQTDVVKAIARLIEFYKHESCGQCTPCREGELLGRRGGFLWGSP